MRTIARQTIKGSIYSYIGALIGFINVGLLMPHIFSTHEVGLTNILISIAAIFGQFGTLGFANVTTRLFPYFRSKDNNNNGFVFLTIITGLAGFALCMIIFLLIRDYLIKENIESSPLFVEYIYLLIPLIFITIFYLLIDTYNRVLFNASFGTFVREFLLRLLNLAGILLYYFGFLSFKGFIYYYTAVYAVPVLLILTLLIYRQDFSLKPALNFIKGKLSKEIASVAVFGVVSGFSGIAAMHIDRYMVNHFTDLGSTGVYATAFFFGTIILLPGRSLLRIAATSIAEAFKTGDIKTIDNIYKKSSINQLIAAVVVFLMIWSNIDNILSFMPEAYAEGKYVIFFISLSYLVLMGGGASSEIIQFSKHYKTYTAMMVLLIVCIVIFNILLIPTFGITGAAIASFLSYLIYVLIKYIYVFYRFKLQPFSFKQVQVLVTGVIVFFIADIIPFTDILILDLAIKTTAVTLMFGLPAYFFNFSADINQIGDTILKRLFNK